MYSVMNVRLEKEGEGEEGRSDSKGEERIRGREWQRGPSQGSGIQLGCCVLKHHRLL